VAQPALSTANPHSEN